MVFLRSVLAVSALVATVAAVPVPQYGYGSSSSGYDNSNSNNNNNYGNSNSYGNNNNNYGNNNNNGYGNNNNNGYGSNGYSSSSSANYNNNNNNYNTQTQDSTSQYNNNNNYNTQSSYNNNNNYNTQSYNNNNNYNTQTQDATSIYVSTSTSTSFQTYSSPSYGSGNSNWGGSDYNNCVQQCLASYSAPPAMYTPSATEGSGNGQTGGVAGTNGVTHTVIVAPTQGVLRYVPFAINASVGDTIQFKWGANNHTVTKSSELLLCNKTADTPFASGEQNEGYMFNQVVNDTNPTFYYCGTPTHCEKGMFGIINPPSAFDTQYSMNNVMQDLVQNSSTVAAAMSYANNMTASNSRAASWGANIDLSSLPAWSHESVAENTLFTRAFLAANPEVYNQDGSIDLSGSTPLMIPTDVAGALNAASNAAVNTTSASSTGTAAPSATPSGHNAARGLSAPSMLIAAVSVAVTFFVL